MQIETATKYTLTNEEVLEAIKQYIKKQTGDELTNSEIINVQLLLPYDEDGNSIVCEGATAERIYSP